MAEYDEIMMGEKRPHGCERGECTKTAFQNAEISVPVEIVPEAKIGNVETECCGEPTVICRDGHCGDKCEVTIIQKLCIKIPVTYKVKVCSNEEKICCEMEEMNCFC